MLMVLTFVIEENGDHYDILENGRWKIGEGDTRLECEKFVSAWMYRYRKANRECIKFETIWR